MEQAQLPSAVKSSLKTTLDLYQLYVRGCQVLRDRLFPRQEGHEHLKRREIQAARKAADDLLAYRRELAGRLNRLASDVRQQMAALRPV